MKKYVTFQYSGKTTVLLRSSIVGFMEPDPRMIWTNVLLDSGASQPLNGMYISDAQKVLDNFDKENT